MSFFATNPFYSLEELARETGKSPDALLGICYQLKIGPFKNSGISNDYIDALQFEALIVQGVSHNLCVDCSEARIIEEHLYQEEKRSLEEKMRAGDKEAKALEQHFPAPKDKPKGGRRKSPLREVVEHEWDFLPHPQFEAIDPDSVAKHIKALFGQENHKDKGIAKRAKFARVRIEKVSGKGSNLKIYIQESRKTPTTPDSYTRKALQDIISEVAEAKQK